MHNYFTNYHTPTSFDTIVCVIICEIIVYLFVIVQNNKRAKDFSLSEGNQFSSHLEISMLITLVIRKAYFSCG